MIPSKQSEALRAIQSLIAHARHEAFSCGAKEVGNLLDDMELLPEMIAQKEDRAEDFFDAVEGIVQKHPQCRYILEQFLEPSVGK